jgi:tRNA/rRNA methyltransferase
MTDPAHPETPQPAFVLVRPQMGENIGAAARAMWNFGLDGMRLVAPRDGWPNPAAVAMASGAMQEAARRAATGERVAMLFGPERAGLENEDVARANALVSVPVNPDFPSLNLAQCVLLCGYEWRRATAQVLPERVDMAGACWAERHEIERLADHYEARLEAAGFFFPEHKAARMRLNLRNLWSRLPLTGSDVRMLHGVMRQMVRWAGRG